MLLFNQSENVKKYIQSCFKYDRSHAGKHFTLYMVLWFLNSNITGTQIQIINMK